MGVGKGGDGILRRWWCLSWWALRVAGALIVGFGGFSPGEIAAMLQMYFRPLCLSNSSGRCAS